MTQKNLLDRSFYFGILKRVTSEIGCESLVDQ